MWAFSVAALFLAAHSGTASAAGKAAAAPPDDDETDVADNAAPTAPHENADPTPAPAEATLAATPAPRSFTNALVSGFLGLDLGGRQMHYRDRVTNGNLRPYDLPEAALLPVAPGLAASAEVFPLASTNLIVARDIGLSSRLNYNIASSKVGNVSPTTRWYSYEINLRGRLLLGPERTTPPLVGIELGLGRQAFTFKTPDATANILPSVDYYYLHFGADGRIPVGPGNLLVGLGYRHIQSRRGPMGETVPAAGTFGEHFPHADITGLDARLGGAVRLNERLEARVLFNYTRYWSTLNTKPSDAYVAARAIDQMLNLDLGVAAFF